MWDEIVRQLQEYDSAVLTVVNEDGYPYSIRCTPTPDPENKILRLELPDIESIKQGRAGILWHKHNEQIFNMSSFGVRGSLQRDERGWYVLPKRHIPGAGLAITDLLNMVRDGRRTAKKYLAKRGLPRPKIPWKRVQAFYQDNS